jgi:methionyl-tRNA formyltransferase
VKSVYVALNDLSEFTFAEQAARLLADVSTVAGKGMPPDPEAYDLVVLWSYRQVVKDLGPGGNVVVFHSSDLPEGRGWAPLYHAVADEHAFYTISGILAGPRVDAGDLLVKARFAMRPDYTAEVLRGWDTEISIRLIGLLLDRLESGPMRGEKQRPEGSYNPRRSPEDNEVALATPLENLVPHLRACEPQHPAFFNWHGVKYVISVRPESDPQFPADLEITFFDGAGTAP